MVRCISAASKIQEGRICPHCRKKYPTWCFLANPVMPNGVDPFCYRCRVITEQAPTNAKKRRGAITPELTRRIRNEFNGAMKDAILKRDGYRCRICGEARHLEVHHIVAVSNGGVNDSGNLVTLCLDHHREAHRGAITRDELYLLAAHNWDDPDLRGITPVYDDQGLHPHQL